MKVMQTRLFLALSLVTLCLIACNKKNKDENPEPESSVSVAEIAGTYEGYSLASCAFFQDEYTPDEKLSISENSDGTASVVFESTSWGKFYVSNPKISKESGIYKLSGEGKAMMGMNGNISEQDCTFCADINSKDEAVMDFNVTAVMGGLKVKFLTGEAPSESL